jgi:hypothetical protein
LLTTLLKTARKIRIFRAKKPHFVTKLPSNQHMARFPLEKVVDARRYTARRLRCVKWPFGPDSVGLIAIGALDPVDRTYNIDCTQGMGWFDQPSVTDARISLSKA